MAHPDLDELLNALLPFAQQMLAKNREFYPFAFSMAMDGQVIADTTFESDENKSPQELIDFMTKLF